MYEKFSNVWIDGGVAPIPTLYVRVAEYYEINSGCPIQTNGVGQLRNGKWGYFKLTMDGPRVFWSEKYIKNYCRESNELLRQIQEAKDADR